MDKIECLISVVLSMVGIMIYVAFRFETGCEIGAVISTIADVAMYDINRFGIGPSDFCSDDCIHSYDC
jgi:hypothetical protein